MPLPRSGRSFDFLDQYHLLDDRVRRLELQNISGDDSILFDVDNEGGWLYIGTNDVTVEGGPVDGHSGIAFHDGSGGGIEISTTGGGPISFFPHGDNFHVQTSDSSIILGSDNDVSIAATNNVYIRGGVFNLHISTSGLTVIYNPTSAVMFKVDATGVYTPDGTVGSI